MAAISGSNLAPKLLPSSARKSGGKSGQLTGFRVTLNSMEATGFAQCPGGVRSIAEENG